MKKILILMFLMLIISTTAFANGTVVTPIAITALDETPIYNKPIVNPSNLIGKAPYGTWFKNFQSSNGWITYILPDGKKLFMPISSIAIYTLHPDAMHNHQVISKEAYIFSAPSVKSKVRAIIPAGSFVFSYGTNGGFYYVGFIHNNQENTGFISQSVVKNIPNQQEHRPPQPNINTNDYLLYSNDGRTFLGKLTSNEFDSDSICNKFGNYGSEFSTTSIWNKFGTYGSEFSSESAFNQFTSTPPVIVQNGKIVGHLTVNRTISNSVSPYGICHK